MRSFKHIPWFYALFTFYPLLFLWAGNISEMHAAEVVRPFLFTLLGSALLFAFLWLLFRHWVKAALMGTLLLVAFFSYGHVYYEARSIPALHIFNHHSVLIPIYALALAACVWGVFRIKKYDSFVLYLNAAGLLLVGMQVAGLSYAYLRSSYADRQPVKLQSGIRLTKSLKDMPDVYVIVLDEYMRSDALKQDMGYDNSPFINQLTQMGFYVAQCSTANYSFTYASTSALLNMRYIPGAYANNEWSQFSNQGFWSILQNDEVRQQLKSIGYKTVAFQEEYPLLEFDDSDVLIGANQSAIHFNYLHPFEVMYRQSTAAIILTALDPKGKVSGFFQGLTTGRNAPGTVDLSGLQGANRDLVVSHVILTLYNLDHLTDIPAIAGPKFTYVDFFVPHYPYVFGPDGQIMSDPGFYGGERGDATDKNHQNQGYINQVQYINSRMLPILQDILHKSKNPPIILLMGDNGLEDQNQNANLMAFYLPDGPGGLYPSISPVNAFRLIFNEYFGGNYPLLPDQTWVDDKTIVPVEAYPDCVP